MTTFNRTTKILYVYLQRPDNAEWVVVGRYTLSADGIGRFMYAPSYIDSGAKWSIDPVNLPLIANMEWEAPRYFGLHDILRDASPDAWGQALIRREANLGEHAKPIHFLVHSGNGDRWGALAVGSGRKPNVAGLSAPRIDTLEDLVTELLAIANHQPTINANLRKRLFATASMGGARPKLTVRDGDAYYLAKPTIQTDVTDVARLESATLRWGRESGLNFAESIYHPMSEGRGVVLVKRFDREGNRRHMTVSSATLLQVQYPPVTPADTTGASYPRLAEELQRIGAPEEDLRELFGRMVFNAMVGNDDDHCRNHAAYYSESNQCWRLTPAFDVVPSMEDTPTRLHMQLGDGQRDISRHALLSDYRRFGFRDIAAASEFMHALAEKIVSTFSTIRDSMPQDIVIQIEARIQSNMALLIDDPMPKNASRKPRRHSI